MTKVLIISLFHPELFRGGAQQVAYELFKELQETPGIEPVLLSSVEATTTALIKSGARITGFDRRRNEFLYLVRDYDSWWHKTGNLLSVESFMEFLEIMQPEVVHFHHFHTFGIDLLSITRSVLPNARIVFTFHEFMAICAANGQMLRLTDQSLCTKASGVRCNQCLPEHSPEQFFIRELWTKKHLSVVDAHALAATIRRACEEPGLWDRLRANLPLPPARQHMASGFMEIYGRQKASKSRSNVIKYSKTYEKKSARPQL